MAQLRQEGMIQALTGPIERNDVETVAKHLEVLQGERRELYCLLAKRLIKVAHLKNPHRDYNGIKNIGGMGNETNCAYI